MKVASLTDSSFLGQVEIIIIFLKCYNAFVKANIARWMGNCCFGNDFLANHEKVEAAICHDGQVNHNNKAVISKQTTEVSGRKRGRHSVCFLGFC